MARHLDVYLYEMRVGKLTQEDSGRLNFQYDHHRGFEEWRLSWSMPVRNGAYDHDICHAFFGGLLPEEGERERLAKSLGVSERNDFSLLEMVGGECAGAVSLYPEGAEPQFSGRKHKFLEHPHRALSNEGLLKIFGTLEQKPLLTGEGIRLSLAGAQRKLALVAHPMEENFYLPDQNHLSTMILKPHHPHYPHLVENEFFCTRMAESPAHLDPPTCHLFKLKPDYPVFGIYRYDRRLSNSMLKRVHQEDFCQALGVPSEKKYQKEGGPSFSQCFALIDSACTRPAADREKFLNRIFFNYFIGNNDAHAKNFSLLYEGGDEEESSEHREVSLAPPYDLICTEAYPGLATDMAMKIGGEYDAYNIFPRHWERFAKECGLSVPYVRKKMGDMMETLSGAFSYFEEKRMGPEVVSPIFKEIKSVFERRKKHIEKY
jgi:serine/threonine-protein kinase HipA